MGRSRVWTIEIHISEHEEEDPVLSGKGVRGNGEELAAAHALADLVTKLRGLTRDDVEQFSRRPGRLLI